jgi:hypothetical protein
VSRGLVDRVVVCVQYTGCGRGLRTALLVSVAACYQHHHDAFASPHLHLGGALAIESCCKTAIVLCEEES